MKNACFRHHKDQPAFVGRDLVQCRQDRVFGEDDELGEIPLDLNRLHVYFACCFQSRTLEPEPRGHKEGQKAPPAVALLQCCQAATDVAVFRPLEQRNFQ